MNTTKKTTNRWIVLLGIILLGANLRAPLTSVGSLASFMRDDLMISNGVIGTITTLPLLAFALLSTFVPKISKRIGEERTIVFSLILLTSGSILRVLFDVSSLLIGTMLIGLAIATGNVLAPGYIKRKFPLKVGLVTAFFTVFMNTFGALASGISVPLLSLPHINWRGAMGFWAVVPIIALVFWIQLLKHAGKPAKGTVKITTLKKKHIWRTTLAWYITLFMGLQSLMLYSLLAWLPEILQSFGYDATASGWLLFLMQFTVIPFSFIIPVISERMKNQIVLSIITGTLFILGSTGLLWGHPLFIPIAVMLIGAGGGSSFALCMMFFSLRTRDTYQASEISGMAQAFGYLLAAIGPVLFGALYDLTEDWKLPLMMLTVISVVILAVAIQSGKDRLI